MNNAGRIGFVIKGDYDDSAKYDFLDVVFYNSASYVAKKVTIGNIPERNNEYWQILAEGGTLTEEGDISNTTVEFEQEENRVNVSSGEKVSKIIGKVKKFFYDLKPVAFSGKYADIDGRITLTNSLLANQSGTALDAVQGKALDDKINAQNINFSQSLDQINSHFDGINPAKAYYVTYENRNSISDISFLRKHPFLFTNSIINVNPTIGTFYTIYSIVAKNYDAVSQIAFGEQGIAYRYHSHTTNEWSNWTKL